MDCRSLFRSSETDPISVHTQSRKPHRYRKIRALATVMASAATALSVLIAPAPQADAVYSNPTGGEGRYPQAIDWIDWAELSNTTTEVASGRSYKILPAGSSGFTWSSPTQISSNLWRTSRCTISDIRTVSEGYNDPPLRTRRGLEIGYDPGTWRGDGLARIYNDGTNYTNSVIKNSANSRSNMPIGVGNLHQGAIMQFKFDCKTYLVNSSTKPTRDQLESTSDKRQLPMEGMVFADAEASNWRPDQKESITVSPIASNSGREISYRLLQTAQTSGCATNSWAGLINMSTSAGDRPAAKLRPDGPECSSGSNNGYGPSSVMLISNMNSGYLEVSGGSSGKGAAALGVVSFMDYGDAPESYGTAGSVFQPSWDGGKLNGSGNLDISAQAPPADAEPGSWFNFSDAARKERIGSTTSGEVHLGTLTDGEDVVSYTDGANGDDITDTGDEDALSNDWDRVIWTDIGKKWNQEITCSGSSTKIAGWVDWNRDGVFSAGERSAVTSCSSAGKATLTWTVPQDAKRSTINGNGAATFMRLRITGRLPNGQEAEDPQPTGITLNGEVEDHQVQVQLPNLTMVKQVDNTAAGSLGLSAKDWTLTATPKSGKTASGAGGFDAAYLPQGQTVLSESSSSPKSAGYKAAVTCVPHPNSDIKTPSSTLNAASKTLDLGTGEWMQCTMVNTALPGQVVWSKVDDAGNPLAGTVFTLASPALNGGPKEVTDCVATGGKATCPNGSVDQDPRAGFFRVSGLTWGEYYITETQAPTGYHLSGTTLTKTLDGSAPAASKDDNTPTLDLGQVTNARIKGSATWTKTDERGNAIKGAQWSLIPVDSNGRPQPDQARTITDCVGTCTQDGLDTDKNPGAFKLVDLAYGSYRLVETKSPAGYILDATPRTITISSQDQVVALGNISNRKSAVPAIPFTGGSAADTFLIAGGAVMGITALVTMIQAYRRRRALNS